MEPVFSREQLLSEWEAVHGRMPRNLRDQFLIRQELRELSFYPEDVIKRAIRSHPRLKQILAKARRIQPSVRIAVEKMPARRAGAAGAGESVLPLPGDQGSTRKPGKKREHYRTGEEAELRHIARKHRWWD